jgi:hypothetical protein
MPMGQVHSDGPVYEKRPPRIAHGDTPSEQGICVSSVPQTVHEVGVQRYSPQGCQEMQRSVPATAAADLPAAAIAPATAATTAAAATAPAAVSVSASGATAVLGGRVDLTAYSSVLTPSSFLVTPAPPAPTLSEPG